MTRRSTRFSATIVLLALACLCDPAPRNADGAPAVAKKDLTLTLKISDKANSFTLEAKKLVGADTNAFAVLRHTVALAYKTGNDGVPVVSSLCGVTPLKGQAWTCTIDGQPCKNIGTTTITKDVVMEWKTEKEK